MSATIAIIGATVSGNHGAEAMLATTIGRLRESHPDARFLVYSYYAKRDRGLVARAGVEFLPSSPQHLVTVLFPFSLLAALLKLLGLRGWVRFLPGSVRRLNEANCLVDLAGVSFIDGREIFLAFNILTIAPAILLGVPVVKFAQAMGPFDSAINRIAGRTVLSRCAHIFARGDATQRHLQKLGLPAAKWSRSTDVAFLMSDADALTDGGLARAREVLRAIEGLKRTCVSVIGICPSSVVAAKRAGEYERSLAALTQRLLSQGCAVVLLPNATRADRMDKRFNNDLPVIQSILQLVEASDGARLLAVNFDIHATEIRSIIAACDLLVTSRFHAMIFALSVATPPLVVGWSHKYEEVMEDFGLASGVMNVDEGGAIALDFAIAEALADRENRRTQIQSRLPGVFELARRQIAHIDSLITGETPR